MIDTCKRAGVLLLYAEGLCFAPKCVRARQLAQEGTLGEPFLVKQSEEHGGPHSPWFRNVNLSGGGALMDLRCHSIEYGRWVLGKPSVKSVTAVLGTFVHQGSIPEDHSICIVEYQGGALAVAEDSGAKRGGFDVRCEIYGTLGHTSADLGHGSSLLTYCRPQLGSEADPPGAAGPPGPTGGYAFTMRDDVWN